MGRASFDLDVAKLFDISLGPVKSGTRSNSTVLDGNWPDNGTGDGAQFSSKNPQKPLSEVNSSSTSTAKVSLTQRNPVDDKSANSQGRKRKRCQDADDLEVSHMRYLAREQGRDDQRCSLGLHKAENAIGHTSIIEVPNLSPNADLQNPFEGEDSDVGDGLSDNAEGKPQHESVAGSTEKIQLEKASRTAFLANVSIMAITSKTARKTLLEHLVSSVPSYDGGSSAKRAIESIRFRSTPFNHGRLPRRAAFVKKELMESTAKSTNAYVVYVSRASAREAVERLNGTVVLGRHLRADSVAHPAVQDHRRCIFVGNLGFVDDESAIKEAEGENDARHRSSKPKEPADYEEGLWRAFMRAGRVESVRLVRDKTTRVGKGFAYVQFYDANAVEKALLFNDKKYPPMLPRKLRVMRAKKTQRSKIGEGKPRNKGHGTTSSTNYHRKTPSAIQSLAGRAKKMLGHAGAAHFKSDGGSGNKGAMRAREAFVFEGHRASQGTMKQKRSRKGEKPKTRSSRRGTEFKRRNAKSKAI